MTIYVGNIPYGLKEDDLKEVFKEYGNIVSIKIIADKFTRRSKGFGFVEMENDEQEALVINECDKRVVSGRNLVVSKAHSKKGYEQGRSEK